MANRTAVLSAFAALVLLCGAVSSLSIGIWMHLQHRSVADLPNLPEGLYVLSSLFALLLIPTLADLWAARRRRRHEMENAEAATGGRDRLSAPPWHAMPVAAVISSPSVQGNEEDPSDGLGLLAATSRLVLEGKNVIGAGVPPSILTSLLAVLKEPTQILLLGIAAAYSLIGRPAEAAVAAGLTLVVLL